MSNFDTTGGTTMDSTFDNPDTGRHPVNTGHLVMGLVFAGLVGIWALIIGDVVTGDDIRWLLPIPWVAGGAIGLAAATAANMRSRRGNPEAGWVDDSPWWAHDEPTHDPADDQSAFETTETFETTEPSDTDLPEENR